MTIREGEKIMPLYNKEAENECESRIVCTGCRKIWKPRVGQNDLICPDCKKRRSFGFKCTKCGYVASSYYGPKVCPRCHPELFTKEELSWKNPNDPETKPKISQAEVIHNKKVTHYSDKPTGNYSRETWLEWYSKLDEAGHEQLRDLGEDPYDPWR